MPMAVASKAVPMPALTPCGSEMPDLAKSGISDPQGVSAGIGTALLATAIGIGTALICLIVYNAFLAKVERLGDETKLALLQMSNQNT